VAKAINMNPIENSFILEENGRADHLRFQKNGKNTMLTKA
jgi:hypothetical protein